MLAAQDFQLFEPASETPIPGPPYDLFFPVPSYRAESGGLIASRAVTLAERGGKTVYNPRLLLARYSTGRDQIYLNVNGRRYGCGYLAASAGAGATTLQVRVADGAVPIFRAGEKAALLTPQAGGGDQAAFVTVTAATVSGSTWTLTVNALPRAFNGGLDAAGNPYTYVASAHEPGRDLRPWHASPTPIMANDNLGNFLQDLVFEPGCMALHAEGLPPYDVFPEIRVNQWDPAPGFVNVDVNILDNPGGTVISGANFNYRPNNRDRLWTVRRNGTNRPMVSINLMGFRGVFSGRTLPLRFASRVHPAALRFDVEQHTLPGTPTAFSSNWRIALYGESV